WQIGKGGGFHYAVAEARGEALPAAVFLGGPPALILAAVPPLPENVPELMLASLLQGERLAVTSGPGALPLVASAEMALVGRVPPRERRPEGPFGDHYGYYSLRHDAPVFPVVTPSVRDLWSYGETGYHSLAAAVVRQRYPREAMASAFRILGEGQLSLPKFLLVTHRPGPL